MNFGLPFLYRPDEDVMVGRAVRMAVEGSLDPRFANYPPLAFDVLALVERVGGWLGLVHLDGAAGPDPSSEYLAARFVSLLAFALLAGLVAATAGRLFGPGPGLLAGALVAVAPLGVRQAHFATPDMLQAVLVAAALCAALKPEAGRRRLLAAGVLAGLAAATKYTGGLVLLPVLMLAPGNRRAVMAAAAIAFLVVYLPAFVLHPLAYLGGLGFVGGRAFAGGQRLPLGWLFHARVTLPFGLGLGGFGLALAGVLGALWRRTPADLALLAYAAAHYAITGAGHEDFFRYELPLLPPLALLAGGLVAHRSAWAALCSLALLPGLYASLETDRYLSAEDTRTQAATWLLASAPAGATVAEGYYTGPFYDRAEVDANLEYSHSRLAAGFLQGRYTDRYRIVERGPADYALVASATPGHAPPGTGGQVVVTFGPRQGARDAVYDPLDSFYVPIWGFSNTDPPGPAIEVVSFNSL